MTKKLVPIIGVAILFIAIIAVTGCTGIANDYSSHGIGSGQVTSVIKMDHTYNGNLASSYGVYLIDSCGRWYGFNLRGRGVPELYVLDRYDGHNVTFNYYTEGGHLRIDSDSIIKDWSVPDCSCQRSCTCTCNYQPCDCSNVKCSGCGC